jgi:hypothetical protein
METKKETLEEAAERMAKEHCSIRVNTSTTEFQIQQLIIKGAKYQAERMYSKEEVEKIVNRALTYGATASFKEWFEQFKKK